MESPAAAAAPSSPSSPTSHRRSGPPLRTHSGRSFSTSRPTRTQCCQLCVPQDGKSPFRGVVLMLSVLSAVVLGFGLGGGLYFRKYILDTAATAVDVEFRSTSYSITQVLTDTMAEAISVLTVLGTTVSVFNNYTYAEFIHVSSSVRSSIRDPILQWAPLITNDTRAEWEAFISNELGNGTHAIKELVNGTLSVSQFRDVYFPISYLDPLEGNQRAILLDLQSNPSRNASLHQAADSANPALSNPVTLVQYQEGANLGVVVFVPVYNTSCGNMKTAGVPLRQTCFRGVVMGVWRFQDLLSSVLNAFLNKKVYVEVHDAVAGTRVFAGQCLPGGAVVFNPANFTVPPSAHQREQSMLVVGRQYVVRVTGFHDFGKELEQTRSSDIVLGLCVGLALLFIVAVWFMVSLCLLRQRQQRAAKFDEARRASSQIDASRQAHNSVVSYICHGLRNPMHVVNACGRLLCEESPTDPMLPAERASIVQDVFNALAQMRSTVDNVLNFRTVQHGGGLPNLTVVDVVQVLTDVVKRGRDLVKDTVAYRFHVPEVHAFAMMDAARLQQIVMAGVRHAGMTTSSGSISLFAGLTTSGATRYLVVDVTNTGGGLPHDAAKLFIPFNSLNASHSETWTPAMASAEQICYFRTIWRATLADNLSCGYASLPPTEVVADDSQSTAGLDLPLARAYASSCQGWLGIEDDELGVTHYWCVLNAPLPMDSPRHLSPANSSASVTHSNPVVSAPFTPSKPAAHPAPAPPSTALPTSPPIVAFTESSVPRPTSGSGSASVVPADEELSGFASPIPVSLTFPDLHVVIVDDSDPNRRILKRFLTTLKVPAANIVELEDGRAAYDFITSGRMCHIMFMDIEMPHMNGDEVMARTHPPFPVVAVTANAAAEERDRYISVGFRERLTKPFDRPGVRAITAQVLNMSP